MLTFLMLPFYTSILSTGQYGDVDLVSTTTNLLLPLVTLGLSDAVFRYTMSNEYDNDDVIQIGFKIPFALYILITLFLNIINCVIKWEYMKYMTILLFVQLYYEVEMNYLKAVGKSKVYAFMGMFQTFIALSFNIYFLKWLGLGVKGYIFAYILSYGIPMISVLLVFSIWKKIISGSLNLKLVKEMLKYSIPLIFTTLSWWIITSSDRYMIRFFLDESSVGIYSVATKIPLILQTVVSLFSTVWEISSNDVYENDRNNMSGFYETGMKSYRAVGFCMGSIILLFVPLLMRFLARGDFYEGWKCVPFLLLSVVFSTAGGMSGSIYSANKKNTGAMISVIWGAVINVILNLIAINYIGIFGVTISTAVSRMFISIYRMEDTKKFLDFDRKYKVVMINSVVISIQAVLLIVIEPIILKYLLQVICIFAILVINSNEIKFIINMAGSLIKKRTRFS